MIDGKVHNPNRLKRPLALMVLLAVVVFSAIVGANSWKEDLKIREIRVEGNNVVPTGEILTLAKVSSSEKLFEVDLYAVQKRVMQNSFIRNVSATRHVPGILTIRVEERIAVAAVILEDVVYLDADGVVLPPSRSEHLFDLPVVTGTLDPSTLVPGKRVAAANVMEALSILATAHAIDEEIFMKISEVNLRGTGDIVLYSSEYGVPVIFGHGDAGPKLVKLNVFWKEFVTRQGAHELLYVDLRFHDQVVVKWRNERNASSRSATQTTGQVRGRGAAQG